jgi:parallel beta-helix repeat protein
MPAGATPEGRSADATLRRAAVCALALTVCGQLNAATIRVDQYGGGDHTTIQAALTAAASGDTVLVAAGVYTGPANRDLDFAGKAVVLASEAGPEQTVLDCGRLGRGFRFHTGETSAAAVVGLTVTNGESAERGGGVLCEGASPRFENCVISGCVTGAGSATGYGGGVYCTGSAASFTNCVLTGNTADEGAAMYVADSSPTLTGCRLIANTAVRGGGGIRILRGGSGAHLTGCTIAGNTAATYGGGIYCCYSGPVITNCTITGNAASNGGAVYGYDAYPTITNSVLAFSTTGAVVYCPGASSFTIEHCVSFGNAGGDSLCGTGHDNVFEDPAFCDTTSGAFTVQECSPCVGGGAGGANIGAWGVGCPCGTTGVPDDGDEDGRGPRGARPTDRVRHRGRAAERQHPRPGEHRS